MHSSIAFASTSNMLHRSCCQATKRTLSGAHHASRIVAASHRTITSTPRLATPVPNRSASDAALFSLNRSVRSTAPAATRTLATIADTQEHRPSPLDTDIEAMRDSPDDLILKPGEEIPGFEVNNATSEMLGRPIYLDMQATTPIDPRVLDAMMPFMTNQFGNPHSRTHAYGWETEKAVEDARVQVASLIGANPKDIIFTSGATETNNMSIKGVARFYGRSGKKHIITTQTEHKCVLDSCRVLQDEGFDVTYLPVKQNGLVDLELLEKSIRPDTCLISIMTINNEIGTIQPIKEIGAIAKKHKGVFFHTDAAQAFGKIPLNVDEMGVDLMSISAHKIYGPKGIGAAYVRRRPRVRLEPIMTGGGQERGLRSGTVPAPLAVGFGEACRIAKEDMKFDHEHVKRLSDRLYNKLTSACTDIVRNGDVAGYPGCLNLSFAYIEGESLLMALKDIALSSGSACTSASLEPSYVLRALGSAEDMAHSSIRFGLGRFTTEAEVDFVAEKMVQIVRRLRDLSPLYEMVQEGIDISKIDWSQH